MPTPADPLPFTSGSIVNIKSLYLDSYCKVGQDDAEPLHALRCAACWFVCWLLYVKEGHPLHSVGGLGGPMCGGWLAW